MGLDQQNWWKWHIVEFIVTLGKMPRFGSIQVDLLEEAGEHLSCRQNTVFG